METWVARFGVLLYLVSDRGGQFEADLFRCLAESVGFHRLRTAAYRPQSNGMVERRHRVLKAAIMARRQDWLAALPVVLLGIRMLPTETGMSPFSAVTGTELLCPPVVVDPASSPAVQHQFVRDLARRMSEIDFRRLSEGSAHGESLSFVPKELTDCTHVWVRVDRVRHSLEAPYHGPFRVLNRSPRVFTVELPSGATDAVSVARLKPAILPVSPPQDLQSDRSTHAPQPTPAAREQPPAAAEQLPVAPEPDSSPCAPGSSVVSGLQDSSCGDAVSHPPEGDCHPVVARTRRGRSVRFNRRPEFVYF